jgi:hypothetical protein
MDKVYCKDCQYYQYSKCYHSDNSIGTPLSNSYKRFRYLPDSKNRDNDCEWYKRKDIGTLEEIFMITFFILSIFIWFFLSIK